MGALMAGVLAGLLLPPSWGTTMRALIGWNVAVWAYLGLMTLLMSRGGNRYINQLARQEDSNAIFVLAVMSLGAIVSLAAIIIELGSAKNVAGPEKVIHYLLTVGTVFGSWLLVAVMYCFHSALPG
jgi:uncharacterized membrane protein